MTVRTFDVVGFDADDTLWHSEDAFHEVEREFAALVGPYVSSGIDVHDAMRATELRHLPISGYGVKAYTLSMVECAISVSQGRIPAAVLGDVLGLGMELLAAPVRLIDGAPEALADLGSDHRLVLITKGDLIHQTRKIETSGLDHHFDQIEVVIEKDVATFARVLREVRVTPERFCMIGNSVRSDVLPVLALGGGAVHVPYPFTWALEEADHDGTVPTAATLAEVAGLVRAYRPAVARP